MVQLQQQARHQHQRQVPLVSSGSSNGSSSGILRNAYDDITLKNKVSTHIQHQLPEFIQADHPLFSKFVKIYYQFLESAEITFSEVNNLSKTNNITKLYG